ncbi:hypothetical protein ACFO8O_05155 [Hephaestia sp. GCM10023244]|uniref:hypothetical protein n=1 Tax=unclassified Hephaestia TaxID=2631281 RepID=UPI002076F446|nr:hypothetical protein [Hephaestia sp. MAHUQ-44]MCM8730354.1 hypothetical protein [Hephaestia sp. MAHUQ-44]
MFGSLALIALIAAPAPALAMVQETPQATPTGDGQQGTPPEKIRNVTVYGNEACPKAEEGEVVVCSHLDANEQFRIPQELRETHYTPAKNSWVNKAQVVDEVSRTAGGLPDTCSPVGSGGQTGCFMQAGRAAAAEKRERARAQESIP